jgi:hypothetical protein
VTEWICLADSELGNFLKQWRFPTARPLKMRLKAMLEHTHLRRATPIMTLHEISSIDRALANPGCRRWMASPLVSVSSRL